MAIVNSGSRWILILISFCCTVGLDGFQEKDDESIIHELLEQLDSDKYVVREKATSELSGKGSQVIEELVRHFNGDPGPESKVRVLSVIEKVLPTIDWMTDQDTIRILEKHRDSADDELTEVIARFLGSAPDPELADSLQKTIDTVVKGNDKSVRVPEELLTQIRNSSAFEVVRRPPTRNTNKKSPWRTINDTSAHQEILMYRIKWFGGNWSGWMLPGVNDHHAKLNRQHWNCFYDHHHEYIQIMTKFGPKSKRKNFYQSDEKPDSRG